MNAASQKASIKYVIYYRVRTKKQGKPGLGLEAQKRDFISLRTKRHWL